MKFTAFLVFMLILTLGVLLWILFFKWLGGEKKTNATDDGNHESGGYRYIVHVKKGLVMPDFWSHEAIKDSVTLISKENAQHGSVMILSRINDLELKKQIVKQYQLADDDITISDSQLFRGGLL